jgi:pilus assembly protein CpaF
MIALQIAIEHGGALRGQRCTLDAPLWIGRDDSCAVVLEDEQISRRHACIDVAQDQVRLRDCSVNGTTVDGRALHNRTEVLFLPAELVIGPYRLLVRAARTPSTSAAVPGMEQALPAYADVPIALRQRVHRKLLDQLDLARFSPSRLDAGAMRTKVLAALEQLVAELEAELPSAALRKKLAAELADEALDFGPMTALLADPSVSEIMVVDATTLYVERAGVIELTPYRFTDDDAVRAVIERIVTPIGRRIDESCPLVDARLPDGSRVNAVIPPLAVRGPCITIRKLRSTSLQLSDLVEGGSLSAAMADFLGSCVRARRNIVIAGGTGSGKTTLLNVLSAEIPSAERIVTIEDAVELRLQQKHVVALEAKLANLEGRGAFTIRDLLKNALRMRPDRIVVGECRGGEAIDMLQAMNTGHEGSMTTLHANSPAQAAARLEMLCLMSGIELPLRAIRSQIASSVHVFVQQARLANGRRLVTSITEVVGVDPEGEIELHELFRAERDGGPERSAFTATGYLPSFIDQLLDHGLGATRSADAS